MIPQQLRAKAPILGTRRKILQAIKQLVMAADNTAQKRHPKQYRRKNYIVEYPLKWLHMVQYIIIRVKTQEYKKTIDRPQ